MEYCENGDLFDFLSKYASNQTKNGCKGKGLVEKDLPLLKSLYLQLIKAVSALHNKTQYAHMDIKLENILISKEGVLRLCDFSFSMPGYNFVNKKMGTTAYMAPELYEASNMPCKA